MIRPAAPGGGVRPALIPIGPGSVAAGRGTGRPAGPTDPYKFWSEYYRKHDESSERFRETLALHNHSQKFTEVHAALVGYLTHRGPRDREPWIPPEPVQSTPAPTAIAFSQMSISEGSAAQRGKAPADVMTAVEEIGVDVGGLSEAFRSMVSVGADESQDESVSQLSKELKTEASLFADTPDDLAEVMSE